MLSFLIIIKHSFPVLWKICESFNSLLIGPQCDLLKFKAQDLLHDASFGDWAFGLVEAEDLEGLSSMLSSADKEYMSSFNPHKFDISTLKELKVRRSMLMMKATETKSGKMIGYFFLRCYFGKIAFHGLFVDKKYRNQGVGRAMWNVSSKICAAQGLKMRATVADMNVASIKSMRKGCKVLSSKHLPNQYHEYSLRSL